MSDVGIEPDTMGPLGSGLVLIVACEGGGMGLPVWGTLAKVEVLIDAILEVVRCGLSMSTTAKTYVVRSTLGASVASWVSSMATVSAV